MRHQHFLEIAHKAAARSNHKYQMAAVLVRGSRVVSIGWNNAEKTHPQQNEREGKDGKPVGRHSIHAELDCLVRAHYNCIEGATIYVSRRKKNGAFGMAKPCSACQEVLRKYKINKAVWSTDSDVDAVTFDSQKL